MIDFNEMSSRILATLEESGSERANPLLNTVVEPTGNLEEVATFQRALLDLLSQQLIVMRMTSMPFGNQPLSGEEAKIEIDKLQAYYRFDALRRVWSDMRFAGPPYFQKPEPDVVLTAAGRLRSAALLRERGFEWWRQNA